MVHTQTVEWFTSNNQRTRRHIYQHLQLDGHKNHDQRTWEGEGAHAKPRFCGTACTDYRKSPASRSPGFSNQPIPYFEWRTIGRAQCSADPEPETSQSRFRRLCRLPKLCVPERRHLGRELALNVV